MPSVITLVHAVEVRNARQIEKLLHEKYIYQRVVGEWFQFDAEQLEDVKASMDRHKIFKASIEIVYH